LDEAKREAYVVLVEGESDSHTLWHHGIPALGIPGVATWRTEWAQHIDGLKVYIWQEPDEGGAEFIERIGVTVPGASVLTSPTGRKDISECHMLGDDIPALVATLVAGATPYETIRATARNEAAIETKKQAGALLACTDILSKFSELCKRMGLVGEERNAKLLYLAVTSRLLERPVSIVVKGPSAAGKSYVVETVLRTFPDSAFYALSSMSERALVYDDEPLQHRMLVIYEAAGFAGDFRTYVMRSLLSEGHLVYVTVEKTVDGLKSRRIEREGPTGLITTTTWASLHRESETRMFSLTVQDDREQTRDIMLALAERANDTQSIGPDFAPWYAFQTWLELAGEREVVIPYARELANGSDPAAVRLRRDFGAVLSLIKVHAILHQEHRQRQDGQIKASLADYRAVYDLVGDLVSEGAQMSVSPTSRETVEAVRDLYNGLDPVTLRELGDKLELDVSTISRRVRVVKRLGYIINLETKKGQRHKLIPGDPLPAEKPVLPSPDDLEGGGGMLYPL